MVTQAVGSEQSQDTYQPACGQTDSYTAWLEVSNKGHSDSALTNYAGRET